MKYKSIFAAAALAVAPVVASAGVIDFTDSATYSGATTSTITGVTDFGVGYTVTGKPADSLSFTQAYDGDAGATPLAENIDGLGIDFGPSNSPDEISNGVDASVPPNSRKQAVTVAFASPVRVTGLHFLDLFLLPDNEVVDDAREESERMQVWVNRGELFDAFQGNGDRRVRANAPADDATGYRFADVTKGNNSDLFKVVNTISFTSSRGNDPLGVADGALAGIDVAPVPLPASILFLLGGLGSLAALRRRKTA